MLLQMRWEFVLLFAILLVIRRGRIVLPIIRVRRTSKQVYLQPGLVSHIHFRKIPGCQGNCVSSNLFRYSVLRFLTLDGTWV
jgi:hypothetical protein